MPFISFKIKFIDFIHCRYKKIFINNTLEKELKTLWGMGVMGENTDISSHLQLFETSSTYVESLAII